MTTISQVLYEKKKKNECALIPFLTAGYPNISKSIQSLYILDAEGADVIELGIPYTDALADGPIIQESSQIALDQGVYLEQIFMILREVRGKLSAPLVIFTYYNPILVKGLSEFIAIISHLGVRGLIIPDLPIEETDYIMKLCQLNNIELILFIAPTSSESRIAYILSKSSQCIYLVSSTGVTGTRSSISSKTSNLSDYIKSQTNKFIIIGFGISNPEQASLVSKWNIDGIVIGSAVIKAIGADYSLNVLSKFCRSIKDAIS